MNEFNVGDQVRIIAENDTYYNNTGAIERAAGGLYWIRFSDSGLDPYYAMELELVEE